MRTTGITTLMVTFLAFQLGACRKPAAPEKEAPRAKAAPAGEPTEPKSAQPKSAQPKPADPAPTDEPPGPPPAIEPVSLGELSVGTVAEVAARLAQAHYDAEALGLRQVSFTLDYSSQKTGVKALVEGRWKSGGPPEISLKEVSREGLKLEPPGADPKQVGQQIAWDRLRQKVLKLVEGIGNGFLSRRIFDWKSVSGGEVKKRGDALELVFQQQKMGQVTVLVGPGYAVQKVTVSSPLGFTRSMTYESKVVDGRNMVASALLEGKLDKKLHKRAQQVMASMDGTRFEFEYAQVGRYLLPVKVRKLIPAIEEQLELKLTYREAKP